MRALSAFQPKSYSGLNSGLVSCWKFDESSGNAADSFGANTLANTSVTYSAGKIGNGAVFNNSTSKFQSTNNLAQAGNFSISFWIYRDTLGNADAVFGDVDYSVDYGFTNLSIDSSNKVSWNVYANPTSSSASVISNATIPATTWTHVTLVRDGTNIICYINGVYDNQTAWSTPQITTQRGTYFGAFKQGAGFLVGSFMGGMLDEFQLWSRALSSSEVTDLYNLGNGRQLPNQSNTTKAYYPLNGSSLDYSGNLNTGTDTAITYPQGRFGQGARFVAASNSKIDMTSFPTSGTGALTVSMWVNSTTTGTRKDLIGWGNGTANLGITPYINTSGVAVMEAYGGNGTATGTKYLTDGKWHNVVLQYTGSNFVIYIDGVLDVNGGAYSSLNIGTTTGKRIGQAYWDGSNSFNGLIDEVIIESRAWTAAEVTTYYRKSVLNYKPKSIAQAILAYFGNFFNFFN